LAKVELGAVVAAAQRVAETTLAAEAPAADREGSWPEASLKELQRELGGLVVDERLGGLGHGLWAVARVGEITGRYCASTSICFGMHLVASAVMGAKATPRQEQEYLRPIAAGEHLSTLALSEPGTGSEFWLPQSCMWSDGGGLRVTRTKSFVTNATHADSYVINLVRDATPTVPGSFSVASSTRELLAWSGARPGMASGCVATTPGRCACMTFPWTARSYWAMRATRSGTSSTSSHRSS
jgi:alkylation response protein AidB-like acyl-CoA dehydrogenase